MPETAAGRAAQLDGRFDPLRDVGLGHEDEDTDEEDDDDDDDDDDGDDADMLSEDAPVLRSGILPALHTQREGEAGSGQAAHGGPSGNVERQQPPLRTYERPTPPAPGPPHQ